MFYTSINTVLVNFLFGFDKRYCTPTTGSDSYGTQTSGSSTSGTSGGGVNYGTQTSGSTSGTSGGGNNYDAQTSGSTAGTSGGGSNYGTLTSGSISGTSGGGGNYGTQTSGSAWATSGGANTYGTQGGSSSGFISGGSHGAGGTTKGSGTFVGSGSAGGYGGTGSGFGFGGSGGGDGSGSNRPTELQCCYLAENGQCTRENEHVLADCEIACLDSGNSGIVNGAYASSNTAFDRGDGSYCARIRGTNGGAYRNTGTQQGCNDLKTGCTIWTKSALCNSLEWLRQKCPKSCGLCNVESGYGNVEVTGTGSVTTDCSDRRSDCSALANNGLCNTNSVYMQQYCCIACRANGNRGGYANNLGKTSARL